MLAWMRVGVHTGDGYIEKFDVLKEKGKDEFLDSCEASNKMSQNFHLLNIKKTQNWSETYSWLCSFTTEALPFRSLKLNHFALNNTIN